MLKAYAQYYWKALTKYQVHSPFVFEFITKIMEDQREFYAFEEIEGLRASLLKDKRIITVADFGAGSRTGAGSQREVSAIAKSALTDAKRGQLFFRMVQYFKPAKMLEIGTSLGVTALYHAKGNPNGHLITLEGAPEIASIAQQHFEQKKAPNIQLIVGEFGVTLPLALTQLGSVDYVLIDGNHRREPTIAYFEACLNYAHEDSIFVFDDIHWSQEMQEAWEFVKAHPKVTVSLDLFYSGIVFFRKAPQEKEHFVLIEQAKKPLKVF